MFALRDSGEWGWALGERQVIYRAVKTRWETLYFTPGESPYDEQEKKIKPVLLSFKYEP